MPPRRRGTTPDGTGIPRPYPRTDICDYLAHADRYGLGPGIYPKHLAPKPPAHPHCRCILQPLTGLNPATKWRERPGAAQAWLREQGLNEGAAVMGSRARRDAVLKGADPLALWNERSDPLYRVRMVREGADGGGLAQQLAASSAVKPMDNARMLPRIPQDMLNGLIARGEAMADKGFMALWTEPSSAERHTRRRIQRGDVVDEHDYIAKTLGVFKEAERIVVVTPINPVMRHTGKVAMISGEWIVLLAENGGIVTSYPHRPNEFETFEQKHAAYGDRIDDYAIPDDIRSRLASLFRRY